MLKPEPPHYQEQPGNSDQPTSDAPGTMQSLVERPGWRALERHFQAIQHVHLRELFADDPARGERLTAEAVGIYLDYSKNRITAETLELLVQLAEECGLRERIHAMFKGEAINVTEKRPALHIALRAPKGEQIMVEGSDVVPEVQAVLDRMAAFADQIRSGLWRGIPASRFAISSISELGVPISAP